MNNEIKLMLNIIKNVSEHKEGSRNGLMILSCKDYKTLLDYITNLQQENERLKEYYDLMVEFNQKNLDRFCDYKSRCEKAIETLHTLNDSLPLDIILSEIEHTEYILQNGSDDK